MTNPKKRVTTKINKQKELEFKKRKHRKIILIVSLTIVILIGIYAYLLSSEAFNIQFINITGNKELTQEEVYELSEIKIGDNIFSTLEIVAKVRLKENGYIQDVKLKKKYPNQIDLEIIERQKKYQIRTTTECYIYIDEQGYLLDYSLNKLELPTIVGMEITEDQMNDLKRLSENDLKKMENILQINAAAEQINLVNRISKIDVHDEYILNLEREGITINLGDATNLKNRMYYVNAILTQENGNPGTIYVNGNLDEGFIPYFSAN